MYVYMFTRVCMFFYYVTPALPQMTQLRMRFCTTSIKLLTYRQTDRVCASVCVCAWCVNAAVVAASIWPYPLSIFYILEPVISCDEPCSLWSCWCCCYYGNLSWRGRRHSLLLPPSAAATRGEIWCWCCCCCCYCYYCQSVLEILLITRYRWDIHSF